MLSRLLGLWLGLGSAQGSHQAGTKPSAQPHQQKGFPPGTTRADSRACTPCLFTPAQRFHEAETQRNLPAQGQEKEQTYLP